MYQTFMNVYTLVDGNTRRKLDEMLNTWKQPAPGSLDTRPVFPPEITRNIESALIKARTAALQHQQTRAQPDMTGRGRANGTPTGRTNSPAPHNMTRNQQNQYQGHSTSVRLLYFVFCLKTNLGSDTSPESTPKYRLELPQPRRGYPHCCCKG